MNKLPKFPERRADNVIRVACDDGWRFGMQKRVTFWCQHNVPAWNGVTIVDAECR